MPSANPQPRGTLFKVLDVPYADVDRYPRLAESICRGEYDVALLRGVFPRATMEAVLERIAAGDHGLTVSPQSSRDLSVPQVTIFGHSITPNDLDRGDPGELRRRYHRTALEFRERCHALFAGFEDYESRIRELFGRIGGGRAPRVPVDAEDKLFTPSTIRRVTPGAEMNLHVGNYFLTTPAYEHLSTLLADLDQLSFFIPLSPPESGGAIEVFELTWQDPRTPLRPSGDVDAPIVERSMRYEPFAPDKGDMFLFNGGRFYHRVDHVVGARPRWTIGGFLSLARDPAVAYYWG